MSYDKDYKPSSTNERETPDDLFDIVNKEFNFKLDAAASEHNKKVDRYFSIENSALLQSWRDGPAWCNPPFSRDLIGPFTDWGLEQAYQHYIDVVFLVPTDPSTNWWENIMKKSHFYELPIEVRHLKPRVKFLIDGKPMGSGVMRPMSLIILGGRGLHHWEYLRRTLYWNWKTDTYY